MKRASYGVFVALVAGGFAARAQGERDQAIVLVWRAPAECPAQDRVRAEIDRLLGGAPNPANHKRLVANAAVEKSGDSYRVRIKTDIGGASGERTLEAPSCDALADVAALVVALTFDPDAVAAHRQETAAAKPTPPPPPEPRRSEEPRTIETPSSVARGSFLVAPMFGLSLGALPGLAYGVGARIGFAPQHLRLELGGAFYPNQRARRDDRPDVGGDFDLLAATIAGCYLPLLRPVELGACADIEIGRMAGGGFGVRSPGEGAALWFAPGAEVLGVLPIGRYFGVRAEVGARVPVIRHTFVIENVGDVYTPAALVGQGEVGVEIRF